MARSRDTWPAGCAVRRAAGDQSSAGLRQGLSRLNRVYHPAGHAGRAGVDRRCAGSDEGVAGTARSSRPGQAHRQACSRNRRPFAGQIRDRRLALEVSVIQTLAEDLTAGCTHRDPLSERVHHRKLELMPLALPRRSSGFARTPPHHDRQQPTRNSWPSSRRRSGSSFYSAMRLMPKAEREAMFAIYAFCRMVDDIADDGIGTREERAPQLDQWRAISTRSMPAGRPVETRVPGGRGRALRPAQGGFPGRHRRHGHGCRRDIVAPDLVIARSLLRPRGERGRPAVDQGVRHGRRAGLRARASSRPRAAAHQHPARSRRGRRASAASICRASIWRAPASRRRDPKPSLADPRIDAACRAVARLAHEHYAKADAVLRAQPQGPHRARRG